MNLGLFFTLGMSLEEWDRLGLLDREKLIYEKLLERKAVEKIYWFTYGVNDKPYEKYLKKGIVVVPMPRIFSGRLGAFVYSFLAPFFLRQVLRDVEVIKTNQMRGSWTAVIASILYRKPLIVRTGYTWSLFAKKLGKVLSLDQLAGFFEGIAYRAATVAVVSSHADAEYVQKKYGLSFEKLRVIGNYIDVSVFKPDPAVSRYEDRIVFVGRLVPQKNLENLIRALSGLPYNLDVYYHDDTLKKDLESLALEMGSRIFFKGSIPNQQLSAVLNKYQMFILPSFYEGMPKVLLEAMACGLAVLGTDVDGIKEIIRHGVNGFLIKGTGPDSLKEGILALAGSQQMQKSLGDAASCFIQKEFSLETTVEKEMLMLKEIK